MMRPQDAGFARGPGSLCPPSPARNSGATLTRLFGYQFPLSAHVEAIVTNEGGLTVFDLIRHQRHGDDAVLLAFDLIELDGDDLRRAPIEQRKRKWPNWYDVRRPGLSSTRFLKVTATFSLRIPAEGIVGKRLGSPYRSGRSPHWVKVKNPKAPAVKREEEKDWR